MPGQELLVKEIMDRGLCSSCGMCVGLCPYIKTAGDRVRAIYPCGIEEGACYGVCPKTSLDISEMDMFVHGREREDHALGIYSGIYYARATARADGAQYGGITTALIGLALREGLISSAILTGGDIMNPRPVLAATPGQVDSCAGSKYTGVPTLLELNRAAGKGLTGVGLAGRPCQVTAVRKLQRGKLPPGRTYPDRLVGLVLGLFCFWSLSSELYGFLARETRGEEIIKMDIPLEGPCVLTKTGSHRWRVDEIRPFINKACNYCFDSTSEWADLSVGSTEQDPGWNTLLVRSGQGRDLVELAADKGVLEIKDYPAGRLPVLRKAALNKKMRVLALAEKEPGNGGCPAIPDKYLREMDVQWGGINR